MKVFEETETNWTNSLRVEDGAVDSLMWGDEAGEIMNDFWPRFDTIVMGRKTCENAMKNATG